jgi:LysM repeat protein
MSYKSFAQIIVLFAILMASFASPGAVQAWSGCGGTYVVQWGDTISGIAAYCGTTVSAIYAANPGISGYLYAGQVLAMPGGYYCNCPQQVVYTGTYTVQRGDTFAEIAKRYGISVNNLWAANPYIWDINLIYSGQVLNVPNYQPNYQPVYQPVNQPGSSWFQIVPNANEPLVERSYGTVPPGTPTGKVELINTANADVYVSLQGTTNDGANVIREYPVDAVMTVKVPAGWYLYVAWVGGKKFSGDFKVGGDGSHTLIFYPNKVVVK